MSNNRIVSRRGSALLVVLGMLSFMVISAVAFSAYMRYSRLPSSYLRRSSASRLLAKAALAEAIDEIDAAIGNNPHPGIGTHAYTYDPVSNSRRNGRSLNRNGWAHRVYLGTNVLNAADADNKLLPADATVSTLTLEGLAYVPPPLVNEARYYSRRSTAAQWKTLDFDSGRYAFCAIDVSDYLDVNSIAANFGRGSSPATRLSLAYLFEDPTTHASYQNNPDGWDQFMKNFWSKTAVEAAVNGTPGTAADRAEATKVPLVSVADLNLAIHAYAPGGIESPFCQYLEQGNSSFYGGIAETGAAAEKIRNLSFVTDGLFAPDPDIATGDVLDLADEQNQPFPENLLVNHSPTPIGSVMDYGTPAAQMLRDRISRIGLVSLFDYLDDDNVPLSLAIPQVERTPMIAALEHKFENKIQVSSTPKGNEIVKETGAPLPLPTTKTLPALTIQYATEYKLDPSSFSQPGSVKVIATYPFHRGRDVIDADTFKIDGLVEFFFTSGDLKFRTGASDCLHLKTTGNTLEPDVTSDGVLFAQLSEETWSPSDFNPQREDDDAVIKEFTLNVKMSEASRIATALNTRPLVTVVRERTCPWVPNPLATAGGSYVDPGPSATDTIVGMHQDGTQTRFGIIPLKADGTEDSDFTTPGTVAGLMAPGAGAKNIQLCMNVYLRVRNGDGKIVDLVPACFQDDKTANGQHDSNSMSMGPAGGNIFGGAYPLMRFLGSSIDVSSAGLAALASPVDFRLEPTAVMCPDPRWNWAPEHWFEISAFSKSEWLSKSERDKSKRDGDIFMATSDAGYMQSVYELAFLPRLTDMRSESEVTRTGDIQNPDDARDKWATSFSGVRNNELMWTTYRPFERDGVVRDPFELIGLVNEGGGVKITPFSDNTNVVMAAFANTPYDWWAAAAEADPSVGVEKSDRISAQNFNRKFAFSEMNSANASFAWKDLFSIAQNFIGKVRERVKALGDSATPHVWKEVYDGVKYNSDGLPPKNPSIGSVPDNHRLDWEGKNSDFCDVDALDGKTDELFGIDRKFLYGYWRECFAPKQQLFLIFVRAEPTIMGGSGLKHTPPQLGARAVALVWRDPTPSSDDYSPHKTRVLFYRQMD